MSGHGAYSPFTTENSDFLTDGVTGAGMFFCCSACHSSVIFCMEDFTVELIPEVLLFSFLAQYSRVLVFRRFAEKSPANFHDSPILSPFQKSKKPYSFNHMEGWLSG